MTKKSLVEMKRHFGHGTADAGLRLTDIVPSIGRYLPYTAATGMSAPAGEAGTTLTFGAAAVLAGVAILISAIASQTTMHADIA